MVKNEVIVSMDADDYWYALIKKSNFSVVLLCDVKNNVCYTIGGSKLSICKNVKTVISNSELYDVFMRKIGKMCKKSIDCNGHYFSDKDGYVREFIPDSVFRKVKEIVGCCCISSF